MMPSLCSGCNGCTFLGWDSRCFELRSQANRNSVGGEKSSGVNDGMPKMSLPVSASGGVGRKPGLKARQEKPGLRRPVRRRGATGEYGRGIA